MIQLGISAFYHDAAACIVKDGKVIAAVEEERFTEIKHDDRFPTNAINWCMNEAGIDDLNSIDEVCWYEDPKVKKDRVDLGQDFYVFTGSTVGVAPILGKGLYTGKIEKLGSVKAIIS